MSETTSKPAATYSRREELAGWIMENLLTEKICLGLFAKEITPLDLVQMAFTIADTFIEQID